MKPATGVVLFAVVFLGSSGASAQKGDKGRCPANNSFGICVFDPNSNCLDDSVCKGGQICCPDGCNRICKDPQSSDSQPAYPQPSYNNNQPAYPQPMVRHCPQPSGQFGICSFDENVNCLSDDQCKNGQMCCSEGCNKVCKDPVTFQPMQPQPKRPNFNNGGQFNQRRQFY